MRGHDDKTSSEENSGSQSHIDEIEKAIKNLMK